MIYIGKYYSDIAFSKIFFDVAILLYKPLYIFNDIRVISFSAGELVPQNLLNIEFAKFVAHVLEDNDINGYCLFYDYRTALNVLNFCPSLISRFIGSKNNYINWLNNKTSARLWLSPRIQTPPICVLSGAECEYGKLLCLFPGYTEFVIQRELSSGGKGTYILTPDSEIMVKNYIKNRECYLVSPLLSNNQSYNAHICIARDWYWISPISKQLVSLELSRPIYTGSTFKNEYKNIDISPLLEIATRLQSIGFRGICGVDFILSSNEDFIFIEFNNRLQGSSTMLDYILQQNRLPSLYELLVKAFDDASSFSCSNLCMSTEYTYTTARNMNQVTSASLLSQYHEIPMTRYWYSQEG